MPRKIGTEVVHRLDRLRKTGGGVCAYIKDSLKTKPLKDLSGISDSGLHQLWIQIQHKKLKSLLLCVTYRPPSTAALCLEQDLMPKYIQALSLGKDIVLLGDLNCDLLCDNSNAEALRSFCTSTNTTQLITKPTRVTVSSSTLIDVILVSNPELAKSQGILDITISDHFLVYAVLDLKAPKPATTKISTRSFKTYNTKDFAEDMSHIPWDTTNLPINIDDKLDAFNDLFQACLDDHAPIKTITIK